MTNYFTTNMTDDKLQGVSTLGLAHIGDAVYELLVRAWLCDHGKSTAKSLHKTTVSYVCAPAQARVIERILPILTSDEAAVYKRGRNAKVNSVPKNAILADYHAATGLECLFGYLYLKGSTERINTLFSHVVEENDAT